MLALEEKKMKKEIESIRNEVEEAKESQVNAYELAIRTIEQNYKREKFTVKCLLAIIIILLAINGYLAYRFATTTVVETWEQDGDWNAINDEGTMINGDYPYGETEEN